MSAHRSTNNDLRLAGSEELKGIIYDEAQILERVEALAERIAADYRELIGEDRLHAEPPIAVGLLRGAFVFLADLARAMEIPLECDFIHISSYGRGTEPSEVKLLKDLDNPISGRHILVVEDIVDTGGTLDYLIEILEARHPASVKVCSLIDKTPRREATVNAHYVGFKLDEDAFVVGYGLDYAERYRNLPYIAELNPDSIGS